MPAWLSEVVATVRTAWLVELDCNVTQGGSIRREGLERVDGEIVAVITRFPHRIPHCVFAENPLMLVKATRAVALEPCTISNDSGLVATV